MRCAACAIMAAANPTSTSASAGTAARRACRRRSCAWKLKHLHADQRCAPRQCLALPRTAVRDGDRAARGARSDGRHTYHQFTIRSPRRDAIRQGLADEGVASAVFYVCAAPAEGVRRGEPRCLAPACEKAAQPCSRCRCTRSSTRRRSSASATSSGVPSDARSIAGHA